MKVCHATVHHKIPVFQIGYYNWTCEIEESFTYRSSAGEMKISVRLINCRQLVCTFIFCLFFRTCIIMFEMVHQMNLAIRALDPGTAIKRLPYLFNGNLLVGLWIMRGADTGCQWSYSTIGIYEGLYQITPQAPTPRACKSVYLSVIWRAVPMILCATNVAMIPTLQVWGR